jgi:hypothetical protein
MRRLALVSLSVVLVISIGGAIAALVDLGAQSRKTTAPRCSGAPDGACWVDVRGSIDSIDCGNAACTVGITSTRDGAPLHARMLVARDTASGLRTSDAVGARVLRDQMLWLRTDGGIEARDAAFAPRARADGELALALLASLACVAWLAIGRLRPRAEASWTPAQWSRFGHAALIVWGTLGFAMFAWMAASAWPFVAAYDNAATCVSPARECRLVSEARVVRKQCHRGWTWVCALTLHYGGGDDGRDALANVPGSDAQSIGQTATIEVFRDEVTSISVPGRNLVPENAPQTRLRAVFYSAVISLGIIAWAVVGLLRRRRAR